MSNSNDLLRGHVPFQVECPDRIYPECLYSYSANTRSVDGIPCAHREQRMPSPTLLHQMTQKSTRNTIALFSALTLFFHLLTGFRNAELSNREGIWDDGHSIRYHQDKGKEPWIMFFHL